MALTVTANWRKLHTLYKSLYNRSIRLLVVLPQRVSWPGFFTLLASIKLYLILSPSTAYLRLETSTDESRNGSFKTIIVFAIIHSCELNIASRSVRLNRYRLARDYSHQTDTVKMFSAFFFFQSCFLWLPQSATVPAVNKFVLSVGNETEEINLYCRAFCLWGWLIHRELTSTPCKFGNDLHPVASSNLWSSNRKRSSNSSDHVMSCIKTKAAGTRIQPIPHIYEHIWRVYELHRSTDVIESRIRFR